MLDQCLALLFCHTTDCRIADCPCQSLSGGMPLRIMQIRLAPAQPPIHSRPMQNFDDWVDLTKVDITQAYFPCSTPEERALAYTVRLQYRRFAVPEAQATGSKMGVVEIGRASLLRKVLEIGLKAGILNELRNLTKGVQQLFYVKPGAGLTFLTASDQIIFT